MDCSAARSNDVDALLAQIAALTARVAEQDARIAQEQAEKEALARKLAALEDALAAADDEVRRVTEILAMFKRRQFGSGSEKLDPDQFELTLEDLEIALSRAETEVEAVLDKAGDGKQRKRRRKNLGALPAHLERIEQIVDIESSAGDGSAGGTVQSRTCPCCNGDLHVIGEDVSERLDVVPVQFRVLVTRRPRYGCRGCDEAGVIQAPAPSFVVDQGIPTDALVAQVVVSKYADHCPLYRQSGIYARQGITIERSVFADWVGRAAWWLAPVHAHLMAELKSSTKLFADETVMPVIAPPKTGRTKTGQLWTYARDDRPWGGTVPPAVAYVYAPDRKGSRPVEHLDGFVGILQVDAYAGYNRIGRGNAVTLALCLAHARRPFIDFADKEPVAAEILRRFAAIYRIEDKVRGQSPEARLAVRRVEIRPILDDLHAYLTANKRRFSLKGKMFKAINYVLSHWDGLTRFMEDGRVELDTNVVERCIKPQALTRKNSLFSATHEGAQNWAIIASLLQTCALNDVDPLAWTSATLTKLAQGHGSKDLDQLMPWNFSKTAA